MAEKQMKLKELRALSGSDLQVQLDGLRQELWSSALKAREGTLQQTHLMGQLKRQIARILTVQGQAEQEAKTTR